METAFHMSESSFQLKNLIDKNFVTELSKSLQINYAVFDKKNFMNSVLNKDWEQRELKQRITKVTESIHEHLKLSYPEQIKVLMLVAPKFTGLKGLIFPEFVSSYGLSNWDTSIKALKYFTPFSTSEFAIRPFIIKDSKKVMEQMLKWSTDKNEHVRRLSSEGCRPRLPWGLRLKEFITDPKPILLILENLKADPSLYVRKSVANNLNDISKDHPDLVLKISKEWLKTNDPNTTWIIKHALRGLLKQGHPKALKLFGVSDAKNIKLQKLNLAQKNFAIGSHLSFSFEVLNTNRSAKKLRIEYIIHYLKKNGSHSKKVFKLTEKDLTPGPHSFKRRHSLKQMTTRQHNPGLHILEIMINGSSLGKQKFNITK